MKFGMIGSRWQGGTLAKQLAKAVASSVSVANRRGPQVALQEFAKQTGPIASPVEDAGHQMRITLVHDRPSPSSDIPSLAKVPLQGTVPTPVTIVDVRITTLLRIGPIPEGSCRALQAGLVGQVSGSKARLARPRCQGPSNTAFTLQLGAPGKASLSSYASGRRSACRRPGRVTRRGPHKPPFDDHRI